VIVGCGFAGLFATYALRRAPVTVTIIDRTNHHLFQPLLYQVATGVLSEGDIAPPIREVVSGQSNVRVLLGEVVDVDLRARFVRTSALDQSGTVEYDSLIVATGSTQSYFGRPEFAEHAPGMKTIDDALELRGRIFGAFEMAERESDLLARHPSHIPDRLQESAGGAHELGVRVSRSSSPPANYHAPTGRRSKRPRVGGPRESRA
jgi:NADH dehydrogenase